ncbi:hypothetical protein [Rhizobium sp. NFR03]|uniref:hypothetical protein n=1 Tax=Rhizobium sp. NFR03 TaxID=1566263 RepID=UPI0008CC757D|nr:hypothetical protein [Rhizobium sp. NFR03]SES33888.1 hypothetical protein SAMN03159406_03533 [Rhizobium sp. NFR03]
MTDIGNPIPRGTIDTDAPLVDEALAAKEDQSSSDAADTVAALKAEIETLRTRISDHRSDAAAKVRSTVRDRPLVSLAAAVLVGYGIALVLHGGHSTGIRHRSR